MQVERRIHRRSPNGTAACGDPVKQEQLTDDLAEVNCPRCWAALRARANG